MLQGPKCAASMGDEGASGRRAAVATAHWPLGKGRSGPRNSHAAMSGSRKERKEHGCTCSCHSALWRYVGCEARLDCIHAHPAQHMARR